MYHHFDMKGNWMQLGNKGLTVSPGIEPGHIVFPSHKNNVYNLVKAYCYLCGKRKFPAVRRVSLMTHRKCRVDRPFPVTWLGNVWEPFPPPPQFIYFVHCSIICFVSFHQCSFIVVKKEKRTILTLNRVQVYRSCNPLCKKYPCYP
jgi:hypothetical protein